MGYLSLTISFIVILIILIIFHIPIKRDAKNVKLVVTLVYPKDSNIPNNIIQNNLIQMFNRGFVLLIITYLIGLLLIYLFNERLIIVLTHIILVIPILVNALFFREKMNELDKKYTTSN